MIAHVTIISQLRVDLQSEMCTIPGFTDLSAIAVLSLPKYAQAS